MKKMYQLDGVNTEFISDLGLNRKLSEFGDVSVGDIRELKFGNYIFPLVVVEVTDEKIVWKQVQPNGGSDNTH